MRALSSGTPSLEPPSSTWVCSWPLIERSLTGTSWKPQIMMYMYLARQRRGKDHCSASMERKVQDLSSGTTSLEAPCPTIAFPSLKIKLSDTGVPGEPDLGLTCTLHSKEVKIITAQLRLRERYLVRCFQLKFDMYFGRENICPWSGELQFFFFLVFLKTSQMKYGTLSKGNRDTDVRWSIASSSTAVNRFQR